MCYVCGTYATDRHVLNVCMLCMYDYVYVDICT